MTGWKQKDKTSEVNFIYIALNQDFAVSYIFYPSSIQKRETL